MRRGLFAALCVIGFVANLPGAAPSSLVRVSRTQSGTLSALATASALPGSGSYTDEQRPSPEVEINRRIPRASYSAARVPADHVPTPASSAIASTNPGLTGFNGISHADQRLAGSGPYANTQFSLEPPDQAFCVSDDYLLESVNTAIRVYSKSGAPITGTVPLNQFFGLAPEVTRSTPPVYGDFTSDPKCHFDRGSGRWFLTLLQADIVPSTGDFTGRTSVLIAVSKTSNPAGAWNFYKLDTTNDGTNGTPTHNGCPCLGDQPLIGADEYGFYVSTNEFPFFTAGFNGAQVYAMSKAALVAGNTATAVLFNTGAITAPDGGIWYSIQPAMSPGTNFEAASNGTEYFLSSLEFTGGLDNRIALWALSNTKSLATAAPSVTLNYVVLDSQVYGMGPAAEQMDGPRPLADALGIPKEKLELLDGNDDRMQQVVYAGGKLWSALDTVVKTATGPPRAGIAWFVVAPSVSNGVPSGSVMKQGYIAVDGEHVIYPSVAATTSGKAALTFTITSQFRYPSAAYASLDLASGATGNIHIAAAGAAPEDGLSGYVNFGFTGRVARWGDYSAAVADSAGNLWMSVEYIPSTPRTLLANWGTYFMKLVP